MSWSDKNESESVSAKLRIKGIRTQRRAGKYKHQSNKIQYNNSTEDCSRREDKMDKAQLTRNDELQDPQDIMIQGNNYFIVEAGNSYNSDEMILQKLLQSRPGLKRVHKVEDCDFILAFCPIASRAGTDIEAALQKLNAQSQTKPAIFVVLHHTFDPDKIVPDSSRLVKRGNTLTVDCLFHENTRLLECQKNHEALAQIADKIQKQSMLRRFLSCITTICSVIWLGIQWCWTAIPRCCNNEVGIQNNEAERQRETYGTITNKETQSDADKRS